MTAFLCRRRRDGVSAAVFDASRSSEHQEASEEFEKELKMQQSGILGNGRNLCASQKSQSIEYWCVPPHPTHPHTHTYIHTKTCRSSVVNS